MIATARKRNAAFADRARFITASLEEADLGNEVYDKVFAVHVAALHEPGKGLEIVRSRLTPGGCIYLFSQAPGWKHPRDAERFGSELGGTLERARFTVEDVLVEAKGKQILAGVVARTRDR
jgi:SAM-dependent methyltransferase